MRTVPYLKSSTLSEALTGCVLAVLVGAVIIGTSQFAASRDQTRLEASFPGLKEYKIEPVTDVPRQIAKAGM